MDCPFGRWRHGYILRSALVSLCSSFYIRITRYPEDTDERAREDLHYILNNPAAERAQPACYPIFRINRTE